MFKIIKDATYEARIVGEIEPIIIREESKKDSEI